MIKIKVNGEEKEVNAQLSLEALLQSLEIKAELVAVEVNLDIVPAAQRSGKILNEGDEVEIVKFVGGGRDE